MLHLSACVSFAVTAALLSRAYASLCQRPNIVVIIADDLGWNDVSFHGSNQFMTPNIDALAYGGVILNNYYVCPLCTPSRASLLTGKNAIRTGLQSLVLFGAEPRGLPLNEVLLPQHMKGLGYSTHLVGKWHLGNYVKEHTPTYRGFDTHLGYWTGHQDYYNHSAEESFLPPNDKPLVGLDMRRQMKAAWDLAGQYSTHIYTNESVRIIREHDTSKPLYLQIAHLAVHSANSWDPIQAPSETVNKFSYITDPKRRKYAAVAYEMDVSVGKVVEVLSERGMLNNTIIVFTTDNGGAPAGYDKNVASNWPLRGGKAFLWEGGVRGVGVVWSPLIRNSGRVSNGLMHISDWLPTLYTAAGGNVSNLGDIDGLNQWEAISQGAASPRHEVLHNIDDILRMESVTVGSFKLLKTAVSYGWDGWYGPDGRNSTNYDVNLVLSSPVGRTLKVSRAKIPLLRWQSEVKCARISNPPKECRKCLFNIAMDPCEQINLADVFPEKVLELEEVLLRYRKTSIPPSNTVWLQEGNPIYWNGTWTNFGDGPEANKNN